MTRNIRSEIFCVNRKGDTEKKDIVGRKKNVFFPIQEVEN